MLDRIRTRTSWERLYPSRQTRRIPDHEREPWRFKLTVCIGAISRRDNAYICVSDLQLSSQGGAVSAARSAFHSKTMPLTQRWLLSFSGAVSDYVGFTLRLAPAMIAQELTLQQVTTEVESAYNAERRRRQDSFLSQYAMDYDSFKRDGRQQFGEEKFLDIYYQLEQIWDLSFLVGGFQRDDPHLFTIANEGLSLHDSPGFAAVGIGADAAITTLYRTYNESQRAAQIAARLLEAKFVTEVSPYIGKDTLVWTTSADGPAKFIRPPFVNRIRRVWKRHTNAFADDVAQAVDKEWREHPTGS